MSKKKSKIATAETEPLSKKDRKKLEAREAKLAAELAARTAEKAERKAKKKGKKIKTAPHPLTKEERDALRPAPEIDVATTPAEETTPEDIIAAADRVIAEGGSEGALDSARKAKVKAKRALREMAETALVDLDRSDAAAVTAYNERFGLVSGTFATSDETKDAMAKRLAGADVPAGDSKLEAAIGGMDAAVDALASVTATPQVAEVVETETGSIIQVGVVPESMIPEGYTPDDGPAPIDFAQPSEAGPELEEGRNGYKIAVLEDDGTVALKRDGTFKTVRQFTRVTSYIGVLEDKTNLEKWKLRKLLEGVALNEEQVGTELDRHDIAPDLFTSAVRDAVHNRDVAIAKARKADRKGKLEVGELGDRIAEAEKAFKDRLNAIAEEALELGGVHEAANKGTDIHALCDLYDTEGMTAVNDLLKAETISPADHADVVAYATAMSEAGIKVLESEVVVVHDALKRAGRLDRIVLAKLPGMQRAVRMVADIKTGNVEWGQAKLAQQLEAYASSRGYDLTTGERRDLKLSRKVGLVIHLPQGKAKASIHPVDLTIGARGNKLAGEVRAFRNEGRNAVDFSVDLAKGDQS